jgi:hypothetical protein
MGWVFTRIRCTEFFRNPERAMKPVFEKLQLLEISPGGAVPDVAPAKRASADLIDRIVRRAEELRTNWSASTEATSHRLREPHQGSQPDPVVSRQRNE